MREGDRGPEKAHAVAVAAAGLLDQHPSLGARYVLAIDDIKLADVLLSAPLR